MMEDVRLHMEVPTPGMQNLLGSFILDVLLMKFVSCLKLLEMPCQPVKQKKSGVNNGYIGWVAIPAQEKAAQVHNGKKQKMQFSHPKNSVLLLCIV